MLGTPIRQLTKTELYVLSYIAQKGPSYGYRIYKKSGYSDKTIYVTLKSLLKKGLLVIQLPIARKKKRSRGRPVNKLYSLTLVGLCRVMSIEEDLWKLKHFNKIVSNWESFLPSLFNY